MHHAETAAKNYYNTKIPHHQQPLSKDKIFMETMGTNEMTSFFYDCIDEGLEIKIIKWMKGRVPSLLRLLKMMQLKIIISLSSCVIILALRYSDLAKDIFLLHLLFLQLGNYAPGSFPMTIFWIFVCSIGITECANFFIVIRDEVFTTLHPAKKVALFLLSPFVPAYILYLKLCYELRCDSFTSVLVEEDKRGGNIEALVDIGQKADVAQQKVYDLILLSSKLQSAENVLENLPYFIVLAIIISSVTSSSSTVDDIGRIFVEETSALVYIFAVISFASMVKGQIQYLKACKNGCLGIKSTLMLVPYFIIGTASR